MSCVPRHRSLILLLSPFLEYKSDSMPVGERCRTAGHSRPFTLLERISVVTDKWEVFPFRDRVSGRHEIAAYTNGIKRCCARRKLI
jgi:hypothetical protein